MKRLFTNKLFICLAAIVMVVLAILVAAYCGDRYALQRLSFRQVTTTQMASAMRNDSFWSTYRENTVIFAGTVTSVKPQDGSLLLSFKTSDPYSVSCELATTDTSFKVGSTYKFAAEAYPAERQPHGVLLHNCVSF